MHSKLVFPQYCRGVQIVPVVCDLWSSVPQNLSKKAYRFLLGYTQFAHTIQVQPVWLSTFQSGKPECTVHMTVWQNSWPPFHFLPQQHCALKTKYFTTLNVHKTSRRKIATFSKQIDGPLKCPIQLSASFLQPQPPAASVSRDRHNSHWISPFGNSVL